jgi:hypothetical protein
VGDVGRGGGSAPGRSRVCSLNRREGGYGFVPVDKSWIKDGPKTMWFHPVKNIIVNDIKPENFGVDERGHLHLRDGTARWVKPGSPLHRVVLQAIKGPKLKK